jgi:hypothetical protein
MCEEGLLIKIGYGMYRAAAREAAEPAANTSLQSM